MDDLFRSENVVVRRVATADRSRWVITFDNYGIGHGFDRLGFGEAFLLAKGVSAIHVMGRAEDWYQYPEMGEAMAAARAATEGTARVMTYGSSMGGYAALRFAEAAGANAVLALSPQYSLDPAHASHDRRWSQDSQRIRWLSEHGGQIRTACRPVVVYDPTGPDGWHGRRIAQDVAVTAIRLPHTAHPVTTYLNEIGLLGAMVFDVLDGVFDGAAVQKVARARRGRSGVYLGELARLQPTHRSRTALALALRAVEVNPDSDHARLSLAQRLTREGRHEEALAIHSRMVDDSERRITSLVHYGDALHQAGQQDRACAVAREVLSGSPPLAHLHAWAAHQFWAGGECDAAREAIRTALEYDPSNHHYLAMEAAYGVGAQDGPRRDGVKSSAWVRAMRWWSRRQNRGPPRLSDRRPSSGRQP